MKRFFRTLLCTLIVAGVLFGPGQPPVSFSQNTPASDAFRKEVFFRISKDHPVHLRLDESIKDARISSLLIIDNPSAAIEILYGLNIRLFNDSELLWEKTFFEKTRHTFIETQQGQIIQDVTDPSNEWTVADRRVTDIRFSPDVASANRMEVSIVEPAHGEAFVRVFQKKVRDFESVRKEWRILSDAEKKNRLKVSAIPPSMMQQQDILQLLRTLYMPLPPQGVFDKDYESHTFFLRANPVTYRDYIYGQTEKDSYINLVRYHVVNICGAGTVRFTMDPFHLKPNTHRKLWLRHVNEIQGAKSQSFWLHQADGPTTRDVEIQQGCSSLTLEGAGSEQIPVKATFLEKDMPDMPKNWHELFREYAATRSYFTRPPDAPETPAIPIVCGIPLGQEFLAIKTSLVLKSMRQTPVPYRFRFLFYNAENNPIIEQEVMLKGELSPMHLLPPGSPFADHIPTTPQITYIRVPPAATRMEAESDDNVLFAFYSTYAGRETLERSLPSEGKSVIENRCNENFAPLWFYFRPANYRKLDTQGLGLSLLRQKICIVKNVFSGPSPYEQGVTLKPSRYLAKVKIMESTHAGWFKYPGESAPWFQRMKDPEKGETLRIPETPYGADDPRLNLHYRCPEDSSGAPKLYVDKIKYSDLINSQTLVRESFTNPGQGDRRIALADCKDGYAYLQTPVEPLPGELGYRTRQYFRLRPDRIMQIPFDKLAGKTLYVNMSLFQNSPDPVMHSYAVEAWIDKAGGLVSFAMEPPPYDRYIFHISPDGQNRGACVQVSGCQLSARQSTSIPLNTWFPPGKYVLNLRLVRGPEALVRFFIHTQTQYDKPIDTFFRE